MIGLVVTNQIARKQRLLVDAL